MDPKLIRRLARIMSGEGLTELKIDDKESGLELVLKRGEQLQPGAPQVVQVLPGAAPAPLAVAPAAPAAAATTDGGLPPGMTVIDSPMVGTFYRSSSPESDPFVDVGGRIKDDMVVCIVEAMKVMNEIKAELSGTIAEILVGDGEPVEFGQPLFLVKKD